MSRVRKARKPIGSDEIQLKVISYIVVTLFAVVCLFPFLLMISSSFMNEKEIITEGYKLIPKEITTNAYRFLLEPYKDYFRVQDHNPECNLRNRDRTCVNVHGRICTLQKRFQVQKSDFLFHLLHHLICRRTDPKLYVDGKWITFKKQHLGNDSTGNCKSVVHFPDAKLHESNPGFVSRVRKN